MLVFKFGGASVKDADSVKNVAKIIQGYPKNKILVVVSAMGKMTNKLEEVVEAILNNDKKQVSLLTRDFIDFHKNIVNHLFQDDDEVVEAVNKTYSSFSALCEVAGKMPASRCYDVVVYHGELLSSIIVSHYLNNFTDCVIFDAGEVIKTDDKFKSATVDMSLTQKMINKVVVPIFQTCNIAVTQGFVGSTHQNYRTTLGREGSDYSGAIFSYCLNARSLTIWKDVDGMFNADPKDFPNAQKIDQVSYKDAIELSYYGASVIHPKTIQPLQNKGIPLYVKSFLNPDKSGTIIQKDAENKIPCYIIKKNQVLVSISSKDFSFIAERHLSEILQAYDNLDMKINIMQNSAVNFSALFDANKFNEKKVLEKFGSHYAVRYNTNLELITIRQHNPEIIDELTKDKEILLEQRTRETVRFVVRNCY